MILNTRSVALAAVLMFSVHSAFAGPAEDARAFMAQGQYVQALQQLDQHLAKNPQDAEARFMRGIALTKLNRTAEAMKVFTDLTRDYPQLPEPYNNLAVLYAQQGDYDKARSALEAALATHPGYATAHENLGDIYSAMAGAAYNRALALDQSNQEVRSKLALIQQVEKATGAIPASSETAKPAAMPSPAPAEPAMAAAKPAPTAPAAAPAPAIDEATRTAVTAVINGWAQAWSAKDASAYLGFYADDFAPEGGQLRAAWAEQRRERILKPSQIKVDVSKLSITQTAPGQAEAKFLQAYQSDNYSDRVNKIIELKLVGGSWKITREYTQ